MIQRKTDHTFAICAYGESPYLEECIQSVLNQTVPTNVLIATHTDNSYIRILADRYDIPVFVNTGEAGITQDWNFAYSQAETKLVTIAHQDDVYLQEYVENLLAYTAQAKKPLIFFTDYGEIRDSEVVTSNKLLNIKRAMLFPLRFKKNWNNRWIRRRSLSLGSAICCPSVSFVKPNLPSEVFAHHFRADEDWEAWEKLSKLNGAFVFCNKILMYHRIHEESETSKILQDDKRSEEDLEMYRKFWPEPIARIIAYFYKSAEKSNDT